MRIYALLLTVIGALLVASCLRRSPDVRYSRLTGTCVGACDHYLDCKTRRGDAVTPRDRQVCEHECASVFSTPEPLLAFERLSCDNTIGFVEGDSGRGPGDLESAAPSATAPGNHPVRFP